MSSPAISKRAERSRHERGLGGQILTFTTVTHPPAGFPQRARTIGLIELDDGTRVHGELIVEDASLLCIGHRVRPRMRLVRIQEDGLRIYDYAYEVVVSKAVQTEKFPGYILALTGPSGVGKTTVSVLLTHAFADYAARVPIVTTRPAKKGDDGEYVHVTEKEFEALKTSGEIVAAADIPSSDEKRLYGYRAADIEAVWSSGKIPIVITEKELLQGLAAHYGRRSILSCGLLPPGTSKRTMLSQLLHRLRTRGRDTLQQIEDRLRNAEADLRFFEEQRHLFDHILVNENADHVVSILKDRVRELVRT